MIDLNAVIWIKIVIILSTEPCNFPPRLFRIENAENIVPVDLRNSFKLSVFIQYWIYAH